MNHRASPVEIGVFESSNILPQIPAASLLAGHPDPSALVFPEEANSQAEADIGIGSIAKFILSGS